MALTLWGQVTHICLTTLGHYWFKYWLVAWPVTSHYLNQCWNIVNWTRRNRLKWNPNRNSHSFIQENVSENVVWETPAILYLPPCVNWSSVQYSRFYLANGSISPRFAGNSPVTGEFHSQRLVTRSFDVFSDLRLNKRFNKQCWSWWFETASHPLWRHWNATIRKRYTGKYSTQKARNSCVCIFLNHIMNISNIRAIKRTIVFDFIIWLHSSMTFSNIRTIKRTTVFDFIIWLHSSMT